MANSGLIGRDIRRTNTEILEQFKVADLIAICKKAADIFTSAELPLGNATQSFDDYIHQLSATTGMPESLCRNNAKKLHHTLAAMQEMVEGLTRGFDLKILDQGYGNDDGRMLSWYREGRVFGAVLPSNSPGVHSLWIPAIALKAPIVLKPGREEPWSPLRIIQSLIAAGIPKEAFGFYPTDHGGAAELLRSVDRAMLFGDASTTKTWAKDPRIELHGPGYTKVLLDESAADNFEKYLEVITSSVFANGGRSCINTSAVWTPRRGKELAEAIAARLAKVEALPADHPDAALAAFANPETPKRISAMIDSLLPGAEDVTEKLRASKRLVIQGRCAYLLPTIIHCDKDHTLANREFLFPFASVVECPIDQMPEAIGRSLVVTALGDDKKFHRALMASHNIQRLNIGPIPTWRLSWDQPHEGNLFEHLYRQRAFQMEHAV
jgi:acyl-CoA reductase-like NAD-dependent aldehyde dehydrogenase